MQPHGCRLLSAPSPGQLQHMRLCESHLPELEGMGREGRGAPQQRKTWLALASKAITSCRFRVQHASKLLNNSSAQLFAVPDVVSLSKVEWVLRLTWQIMEPQLHPQHLPPSEFILVFLLPITSLYSS